MWLPTGKLASRYLQDTHGQIVSPATLAHYRTYGGGPGFHKCGRFIYYATQDLDAWARARISRRVFRNRELHKGGRNVHRQ